MKFYRSCSNIGIILIFLNARSSVVIGVLDWMYMNTVLEEEVSAGLAHVLDVLVSLPM